MTAAETLREAADALRFLANTVRDNVTSEAYWDSQLVPASNVDGRYAHGVENAVGGVAGEYAAMLTPGVGLVLADWLEMTADAFEGQECPDGEPALKVARLVLGVDCPGTRKEAHDA